MFQFIDPAEAGAEDEIVYWRRGYWHLCLTVEDLPGTLQRILASGGKQTSPVSDFVAGRP